MLDLQPSAGVVLVIGGGHVAARKVRSLSEAGFAVEVVAPTSLPEIAALAGVTVTHRAFDPADIAGKALVFACTDDSEVNAFALVAARRLGVLANAADAPEDSDFHSVATHHDGALIVGVSTGGGDPALAAEIRDRAAAALGPGWGARIEAARATRARRLQERPDGRG